VSPRKKPLGGPASAPNSPYTSSISLPVVVDNGNGCQPRFRTTSCRTLPKMAERPEGLERCVRAVVRVVRRVGGYSHTVLSISHSSLKTSTTVKKSTKSKSKDSNEEKGGAADNDNTSPAQ
jgi:hypothetical protein